ncbi:MAG: Adenylate cyclase 1 [Deltaproteobacteria bacterium]|jgi:class 3 adenylate cyclase/putative methionine-R-sulfoxide reductase with GAF domain|nr:Adenylate cyclase 1 [Deltaproteobacteria bacterium]
MPNKSTNDFQDQLDELKKLVERKTKEIEIIQQASSKINATLDLEIIADAMLSSMDKFFGFQHSMILMIEDNGEALTVLATHGYENQGIGAKVKVGVGVIGMVAKRKKLMRMANLGMQRGYMQAIRQQVGQTTDTKLKEEVELPGLSDAESQVAIPMLIEDALVGVFSVESREVNIFDKADELLIGILANQAASALQHARLYQSEQLRLQELNEAHIKLADLNANLEQKVEERTAELLELSAKLAKYFSPQVYDSIFSGKLDVTIQTQRKPLTVFFSDLQGFTELTERLEPEILTELLTHYLTEMSKVAIKWGGTIDKFIGDAVLVFFGDPISKGNKKDAVSCVSMALEMLAKLKSLRGFWRERGVSRPLNVRIGIHTGVCTVGNFGSEDRLDYTVIGNGVNLASRLESSADANQILISEDTYLLVKQDVRCKKHEAVSVKGVSHPVQTYEVSGLIKESKQKESPIDSTMPGLSLTFDPSDLEDHEAARKLLSSALKKIKPKSMVSTGKK